MHVYIWYFNSLEASKIIENEELINKRTLHVEDIYINQNLNLSFPTKFILL